MTDQPHAAEPAGEPPPGRGRQARAQLMSFGPILVFDVAGPLVLYALLRGQGVSVVPALAISGIFPAFGVALSAARRRRLDAIGLLVLFGIVAGVAAALITSNARLVLIGDSVPTAAFGVFCLGSLWTSRPLIYRFALETIGPDTPRGREFESMWRHQGFRHVFRVLTVGWGVAFLAEAAARVIVVENTSTGTALAITKVMPYLVAGVLIAWTVVYGRWSRRKGEAAARAAAQASAD